MLDNPRNMFTKLYCQPVNYADPLGSGRLRLMAWTKRVMVLFMFSIGIAIASPAVHPQSFELVCTSSGAVKAIVYTEDGVQEVGVGHFDCPACVFTGPLPPAPTVVLPSLLPLSHAVESIPAARIAAATAAPLPARGPPKIS